MKEKLIRRLKEAMDAHEVSAAELARRSGIRASSISDYLKGKYDPKQDKIALMAEALSVTPAWLMGYDEPSQQGVVRIPVLGRVVAGIPLEAIQEIEDWEEIPAKMAAGGKYFALRIKGSSMEPKLEEGDTVIVRQQEDVDSGDTAIVLVNGNEATVKQVKKTDSGIMLVGFNMAVYSPHFYSKEQIESLPVRIIGKVVESRHIW